MELTKEQFKAQFKHEINNGGLAFNLDMLVYTLDMVTSQYKLRLAGFQSKLVT